MPRLGHTAEIDGPKQKRFQHRTTHGPDGARTWRRTGLPIVSHGKKKRENSPHLPTTPHTATVVSTAYPFHAHT